MRYTYFQYSKSFGGYKKTGKLRREWIKEKLNKIPDDMVVVQFEETYNLQDKIFSIIIWCRLHRFG